MRLTMRERRTVIGATAKRYQHSTKTQRGVILDEFTQTTSYSRKHAAWVLTNWLRKKVFTVGGVRTIYVFGLKKSKPKGKNAPKRPATTERTVLVSSSSPGPSLTACAASAWRPLSAMWCPCSSASKNSPA
jgi:hypothetical protein